MIPGTHAPTDRADLLPEAVRPALFAIHQGLYHALRLLDTPDSPLGAEADEARRALRRAWVATHGYEWDELLSPIHEPEVVRAMYRRWAEENADEIARAEHSGPLAAAIRALLECATTTESQVRRDNRPATAGEHGVGS